MLANPFESGSNLDSDPQHWLLVNDNYLSPVCVREKKRLNMSLTATGPPVESIAVHRLGKYGGFYVPLKVFCLITSVVYFQIL